MIFVLVHWKGKSKFASLLTIDRLNKQDVALYQFLDRMERCEDKLKYRYPGVGGESVCDVIERLQPLLIELERSHDSCLLVTHSIIIQALLAYIQDLPSEEMLAMNIPLHRVYCVEPLPYGYVLNKWDYDEENDCFKEITS